MSVLETKYRHAKGLSQFCKDFNVFQSLNLQEKFYLKEANSENRAFSKNYDFGS